MKVSLFQGVLMGIFGVAALAGLFVFATYSGSSGKSAVGTVVIWGTLPSADIDSALVASAKIDQTLKNVSYVQKDPATLKDDLAAAIATGKSPDLVLASQEELLALAPFLSPTPLSTLSAATFQNAFVSEGNLFAAPTGGGYYGIPFLVDPVVLYSNQAILSSDGIAQVPSTWEALTGLVPNIAQLTPSRQITRGLIALGTYDNVHDARGILSTLFLQTGVPLSGYSSTGVLSADLGSNTPGGSGVPPGQAVLGFYTQFADPSKVSYTWNASLPDSQTFFQNGNLALYLGFASEAGYFAQANPNLSYSVSPVPQPATATGKATYGLLYAFMTPKSAPNTSGAYQAAVLLSNTAEQEVAAQATGLAPAARAALSSPPPNNPAASVAYQSALYAEGWLSPVGTVTDPIFSGMIGNVISGRTTLATALSSAESALSAQL